MYLEKKGKVDDQTSRDMLSDLPLSIIHIILPLVPIIDAIRTCVLSRQWRYTWTTLPHLVFDEDSTLGGETMEEYEVNTNKFVMQALLLHKGPVHRFEMEYSYFYNISFEKCILSLPRNDIREIIIKLAYEEDNYIDHLRSSLYSCTKLTKLVLWNFVLDPPPSTFKGFLFLRSLFLEDICLRPDPGIETIFANSPLLEKLTIKNCQTSKLTISSPNLKHLCLVGEFMELCLYSPLLAEMDLDLRDGEFISQHESLVCNFDNFIGGLTNLEKLSGLFTKYLSIGIESCHDTLVFHHLKVIELYDVDFEVRNEISVIARLINGAPNLHKLVISPSTGRNESGDPDVYVRNLGCGPNFTLEKLRVVSMPYVKDLPSLMQLIKFLLERSPVLETMDLGYIQSRYFVSVTTELLGFTRASPYAKISITP